jgi:predicted nuclease with RNAse H fold
MKLTDKWADVPSNVKVVEVHPLTRGTEAELVLEEAPARNRYLQRRDEDLAAIIETLTHARTLVDEAVTGFGMYETPKHRDLPILIDHQIEQITEYQKMKG